MLKNKVKEKVIKKSRRHETDTGSAEVQTALLSTQIDLLSKHLKKHRKDEGSRRGLLKLVAERRTLNKYLDKQHSKKK